MKRYGCIGRVLGHSFSREIHALLADYTYELFELSEDEVESFLRKRDFAAINVTIPYKETVIPYLDSVSEVAAAIGAVNTVINRDGKLYGYNTDYDGMRALIMRVGVDPRGRKVMILGTGGTSKTARAVVADMGAAEILTVSRKKAEGTITYEEAVTLHADAELIINTTPVGMYPSPEGTPIDISAFSRLLGVIDAVYNPLRTNLILDAEARGIPAEGGLYMLVMQAVSAVEKFLDTEIDRRQAERVYAAVRAGKESIVLTGMPGSGKSTVAAGLVLDGFTHIDTDAAITERYGATPAELISSRGEAAFRALETEVIRDATLHGSAVISTGGGAILREENVRMLKRYGRLFFLDAARERLVATADRPLSNTPERLDALYRERIGRYRATADLTVPDLGTPEAEAAYLLEKRMETML